SATRRMYTLSLHDALPILDKHPFLKLRELGVPMTLNTDDPVVLKTTLCKELHWAASELPLSLDDLLNCQRQAVSAAFCNQDTKRSEEHTSELQSRENLVCR